jgi:DNA invertase Pin-like site-specific DNA recombinase
MLIGYARVSTEDQNLDMQVTALVKAGAERVFTDKASGASTKKRPGLAECLRSAERGDVIVVWALDRIGRSLRSLLDTLADLERRGVGFRSLSQYLDTTTPVGRFGVQMMGAVAELERELIRERTRAGMAAAKARGSKVGRAPKATPALVGKARRLIEEGMSYDEASAETGLAVSTLYRDLPGGVRAIRDAAKQAA